jgi:hypothetical protein
MAEYIAKGDNRFHNLTIYKIFYLVVSKSGNPGPGPVPKTRAQIRIFFITSLIIKALILIKLLKLVKVVTRAKTKFSVNQ